MLEKEGLCDVRQGDCSTVKVYGQGFRNSYQLKCEFVKEKVLRTGSIELNHGYCQCIHSIFIQAII